MNSRREFLKGAATGAVILGAESSLGLTRVLDQQTELGQIEGCHCARSRPFMDPMASSTKNASVNCWIAR